MMMALSHPNDWLVMDSRIFKIWLAMADWELILQVVGWPGGIFVGSRLTRLEFQHLFGRDWLTMS